MRSPLIALLTSLTLTSCAHTESPALQAKFEVSQDSVAPGSKVSMRSQPVELYSGSLKVGERLADKLPDFDNKGKVAIVIFVPSVDTPVCEAQTHELGESKAIPTDVMRFAVSRDLPMAQSRFAKEAKLTNITYLSDYKDGSFGKKAGLMMKGPELLARGVIVVDRKGVVRHIQVVPEVTELPDLAKAIEVSRTLL